MTKTRAIMPSCIGVFVCILWLLMLVFSGWGLRQAAAAAETQTDTEADGEVRTINVYLGSSKVVDSPWPVARVSITSPEIADVQVLTPQQVLLLGKSVGTTDLILWSKEEKTWKSRVGVKADLGQLKADMAKLFPGCRLNVSQSGKTIIVSGLLSRAEQAVELRKYLDTSGLQYMDMTKLAGVQQVQIEVCVAEVSRQAIRTLGFNMYQTRNDFFFGQTVGSASGGPLNPISIGPVSGTSAATRNIPVVFTSNAAVGSAITLFGGLPNEGFQFFLQALKENQYLRLLAQPTLVALSGEEATFLAGGEFPIPVVQGSTGTVGGSSVTIEYREFGVELKFRPTVLGDGRIRMYVAPSVSSLSDVGAVIISGFSVPSLNRRSVSTTLEMNSGQTFAIAGLLNQNVSAVTSRLPGIGDLPIIGQLFKSIRYTRNETELLIIVKASLVEPMNIVSMPPGPGVMHTEPDDWELFIEGRIDGKVPPKLSQADAAWLRQMGLDRLKGPGAWAGYGSELSRSQATARPSIEEDVVEIEPKATVETEIEIKGGSDTE